MSKSDVKQQSRSGWGIFLAGVLGLVLSVSSPVMGKGSSDGAKGAPIPVGLDRDKLAGIALPPSEPFILPEQIIEGNHRPRGEVLYKGEELIIEIYEDDAATYAISDPYPVDEYVLVMSGKLVLTDSRGKDHEYLPGDSLIVPMGFTGVWKMVGKFRELIAIERSAYDKVFGAGENAESTEATDPSDSGVTGEDTTGGAKDALPIRLDPDKLAGIALTPEEPFILPDQILEGNHTPRGDTLYLGKELVMKIYEDDAAAYAIRDPFPCDEFVLVMDGKLTLTDSQGKDHEYLPGDALIVPNGFTGIWKMAGNYRELIAIDRGTEDRLFASEKSAEGGKNVETNKP
ncbi:MAG: cupin domain-containing protein [bacterium]|jgi:uncharacterized cupin superfamily protein|nr:cupin domain-containing protein [bacterium]